jgi:hypothetical protein
MLLASSSAQRLKPHAIDIRVNIDPAHWFLSPPRDIRSSLYLEDAATEFQVQGLELDWTKSHVGRRPPLAWKRLELSQFSRAEVDRREEARAAAVSEERLPRVAHAGPAGDGDLRTAGGEPRPDAEARLLRGSLRLPDGHGRGGVLGRLAEFRRLAPLGLVSFALAPLRVNFAEVPQIAFDATAVVQLIKEPSNAITYIHGDSRFRAHPAAPALAPLLG